MNQQLNYKNNTVTGIDYSCQINFKINLILILIFRVKICYIKVKIAMKFSISTSVKNHQFYKVKNKNKSKMSAQALQISVLHNRKDRSDQKVQKFENVIGQNMTVTCRDNFNEYLYNSSLHGLRYVGDRTITRLER